jgi:ribosomal protein S7
LKRAEARAMDMQHSYNADIFNAFMKDKKKQDAKGLVIDAYEAINTVQRQHERDILNAKRFEEYEKNRPPSDKWWEVKTANFNAEVVRNRVSLDGNKNADYLEKLLDRNIY